MPIWNLHFLTSHDQGDLKIKDFFFFQSADITEVTADLNEVRDANRQLLDEKTSMQHNLSSMEEAFNILEQENQDLKMSKKDLEKSLEAALRYHDRWEELSEVMVGREEKFSDLKEAMETGQQQMKVGFINLHNSKKYFFLKTFRLEIF